MENQTITTVNGYVVTLRPFLTYDQFVELQKMYTKDTMIDPNAKDKDGKLEKPKIGAIPANIVYEISKRAVGFLVISIKDKNGNDVERATDELPLPIADGQQVADEIQVLQDEAAKAFDKKKAITS